MDPHLRLPHTRYLTLSPLLLFHEFANHLLYYRVTADSRAATKLLLELEKNQTSVEEVPENNDVMPFDQPSPKPTDNNNSNNHGGSVGSFSDLGADSVSLSDIDNNKDDNLKKKSLIPSCNYQKKTSLILN